MRPAWRHIGPLLALPAACLGVLAGCATSHAPMSTSSTAITARESAAPLTASATTATAAPQGATVTVEGTTTISGTTTIAGTTTIDGTTTTVLPGTGRPPILLGDMNTPEQFIIGQLYLDALTAQGYSVELTRNIGATDVSEAALSQGSLDIFPEYLNVYDSQVAGLTQRFSSRGAALAAGRRYAAAHGQVLLNPTPFGDTAGIAVLSSFAAAHHLRSIGDLRRVQAELTLGAPLEYIVEPSGLPELERAYSFTPAVTAEINLGSQYSGLHVGTLQAAYVQTSDPQLARSRFRLLEDPRHVLGFGNVVPVVSAKALALEGPAFAQAINQVDALLGTGVMRGLAQEMAASADPAQSASEVAKEFLQGYGIGPAPSWSSVTITTSAPGTSASTTDTAPGP